jgi:hypothetical protein
MGSGKIGFFLTTHSIRTANSAVLHWQLVKQGVRISDISNISVRPRDHQNLRPETQNAKAVFHLIWEHLNQVFFNYSDMEKLWLLLPLSHALYRNSVNLGDVHKIIS